MAAGEQPGTGSPPQPSTRLFLLVLAVILTGELWCNLEIGFLIFTFHSSLNCKSEFTCYSIQFTNQFSISGYLLRCA